METLGSYRRDGAVAVITLDDGKANVMSPRMDRAGRPGVPA
jgi:hypothetical protein